MDVLLIVKGAVIGFVVAAPAGPIAFLCIHRTLGEGRLSGIATGLGAAFADTVLGAVALFGVGLVADVLAGDQAYLRLVGGLIVCGLGVVTLFRRARVGATVDDHLTLIGSLVSGFGLTLVNPITIFAFLALFSGAGLGGLAVHRANGLTLILGVLGGTTTWWMLLPVGTALFRGSFTDKGLLWVTRVSGVAIAGFGVAGVISGLHRLLDGV
jgi:threonine/homoserine/homoserine lactone efflux protein